jgi:hypothetical protein
MIFARASEPILLARKRPPNAAAGMKRCQEYAIDYFQDEDGMFTAEVPAIRGCVAWGKTLREAHCNAMDAVSLRHFDEPIRTFLARRNGLDYKA